MWEDEDEDDWDDEPPKKKKKGRKKKYFPKFDWDELSLSACGFLKSLIKSAEKGLIPNKGLQFRYNDVELVVMDKLSDDYLEDLAGIADGSGWDENIAHDHTLYHDYLVEIIEFHLNQ